jgi:pilus assembly protein CpaD
MRRNHMTLLVLPLMLAACVPGVAEYSKTEAPATLQLYGSPSTVTLSFAAGSAWLSAAQGARLQQLVRSGAIRPADRVEIAAAGSDGLARARFSAIAQTLLRYGIVADQRRLGGVPSNQAVILVGRYAAILPPCPNWSQSSAEDFTNQLSSNFGCADAINLGMTVASPADLAGGRTLEAAMGRPVVSAVNRYLTDNVTPLAITTIGPIASPPAAAPAPIVEVP